MVRRYELTDEEWNRIKELFPPDKPGKMGRPPKENRLMLNAMGFHRSSPSAQCWCKKGGHQAK